MYRFCNTPLGSVLLTGTKDALTGLYFAGQAHFPSVSDDICAQTPLFRQVETWLDAYFAGKAPPVDPIPLSPRGTPFQKAVWTRLLSVPYGATVTYGALAAEFHSSARAVGGAVGRNPISLLIPCHRVLGADGRLTGYAGGLWRKEKLLLLEQNTLTISF